MFKIGFEKVLHKEKHNLKPEAAAAVSGGAAIGYLTKAKSDKNKKIERLKNILKTKHAKLDTKLSDMGNYTNISQHRKDVSKAVNLAKKAKKYGLKLKFT